MYDASSQLSENHPSLNDCLETGPPLQNKMYDIMVKNCIYPIANTGDLKQVFLQIRIAGNNRDVLHFHWISDLKTQEAQVLRFTKAIFSLNQSRFLLGRSLENHLQKHAVGNIEIPTTFREDLYVDNSLGGTEAIEQARQNKEAGIVVFRDATFELHKWHSNIRELHGGERAQDSKKAYTKKSSGASTQGAFFLGHPWDKAKDHNKKKYYALSSLIV